MNEFIKRDGQIIVNVDHAIAYIRSDLFKDEETKASIATEYGEGFRVLGAFNMRLSNNPDEDIEKTPLRTFNFPNMIETYPSSNEKKTLALTPTSEEIDYRLLHYRQGDIMMSATMPKSADNVVKYLDALTGGKLPNTIPYNDLFLSWISNFESNDNFPNIPGMYLQAIIAEKCRSRKDPSTPFRKIYGKNMSSNDYITTNMRGTAAYSSVFASQAFEHMGRMLHTSVNMTRRNIPQNVSPIEKTLYM